MLILRGEIPVLLAAEGAMVTSKRLRQIHETGSRLQTPFEELAGIVQKDDFGIVPGLGTALQRGTLMQNAAIDVAGAFASFTAGDSEAAVQQLLKAAKQMKRATGLRRSDLANEMLDKLKTLDKLGFGEGVAEAMVLLKDNPVQAAILIQEVLAEQPRRSSAHQPLVWQSAWHQLFRRSSSPSPARR